jgi:putative DNA primase/helicase
VFHGDGIPAGSFGDWRTGTREKWHADIGRDLSPAEAAEVRRRAAEAETKRKADETFRQAKARKRAAAMWQDSEAARADHPYLSRKGVKPHGIRQCGDNLLIPMRDADETLHNVERIFLDGKKIGLKHGRRTGCYFAIGKPVGTLCIGEGFATGASIHEATGYAVAVALGAGNLEAVAVALHAKMPDVRIVLCADDDYRTDGNPGIREATKAVRAVGGLLTVPDFGADRPDGATDFNDLARLRGPDAVKQAVDRAKPADIPEGQPPAPGAIADDLASRLAALAAMPALEYDRVRKTAAAQLVRSGKHT